MVKRDELKKWISSGYHGIFVKTPMSDEEWEELRDLRNKTKAILQINRLVDEYFGDWFTYREYNDILGVYNLEDLIREMNSALIRYKKW